MSVTLILLIANVLFSISAFRDQIFFNKLMFSPYFISRDKQYYRFLTSGFIHADWVHLFVNMYVLYYFGNEVENNFVLIKGVFGKVLFLLFYLLAVVCSSIPSFERHKEHPWYTAVGASGATSAIVFSVILLQPWNEFYLFLIPIGIPAFIFGILYLGYSYYMSKKGQDNIAHDVHFFGALFGIIFTLTLDKGIFGYFIQQLLNR